MMLRPRCVSVAATLAARGEDGLTDPMISHVDSCLACRSELSAHRELRDQLRSLALVTDQAPAEVYPNVMAEVGPWAVPETASQTRRTPARIAAAAAVATAAATAAAGTAVLFKIYRQRAA
ncbi:MAG: hypothetical protein ACR2N2_06470 [Acidimicrobiia bacterium]